MIQLSALTPVIMGIRRDVQLPAGSGGKYAPRRSVKHEVAANIRTIFDAPERN